MDLDLGKNVAWDKSCAYCQGGQLGNQIVGFSLPYQPLQDPADEATEAVAQSLEQAGDLREGGLFRCRHCGRPWLDNGQGFCSALSKRDIPVVIRWNARPLVPDETPACFGGDSRD